MSHPITNTNSKIPKFGWYKSVQNCFIVIESVAEEASALNTAFEKIVEKLSEARKKIRSCTKECKGK